MRQAILYFLKLILTHFAKGAESHTHHNQLVLLVTNVILLNFELHQVYLKEEDRLFVYEGITSRPNTNVVDWNADQFLYPLHIATSSFWESIVISY